MTKHKEHVKSLKGTKASPAGMPDIGARLEKTFGDTTYQAKDIAQGLQQNQEPGQCFTQQQHADAVKLVIAHWRSRYERLEKKVLHLTAAVQKARARAPLRPPREATRSSKQPEPSHRRWRILVWKAENGWRADLAEMIGVNATGRTKADAVKQLQRLVAAEIRRAEVLRAWWDVRGQLLWKDRTELVQLQEFCSEFGVFTQLLGAFFGDGANLGAANHAYAHLSPCDEVKHYQEREPEAN